MRRLGTGFLILLAGLILSVPLFAASIDPVNKYAWAENAGWLNWRDTVNNYGSAQVFADHLEGDVWAENIGWIRLGSHSGSGAHSYANTANNDYGVNRAGTALSGYAWSENTGWINFAPTGGGVTIGASGQFDGYAWGENVGWIHLCNASPAYGVAVLTGGAVTLTSSLNPSTVGQSVTFTATVGGTPTPTGTVSFTADSVAITGCTAKALTSGVAACITTSLSDGNRAIAAAYSGDSNYPTHTGNLTQTVSNLPVNGACGSANGQTLTSAPTSGLCSVGTASSVSGSGPWSWSCAGTNGGTTDNCSALFSSGGGGDDNGGGGDGDNIPDSVENAGSNGGDGNGDGVPDSQQGNVTSLPLAGGSAQYLTLQTPPGTRLGQVTVQTASQSGVNGNYPWGVLSFEVFGPSPVTVTLYLPGRSAIAGLVLNKILQSQARALSAQFSVVQIGGQPALASCVMDSGTWTPTEIIHGTNAVPMGAAALVKWAICPWREIGTAAARACSASSAPAPANGSSTATATANGTNVSPITATTLASLGICRWRATATAMVKPKSGYSGRAVGTSTPMAMASGTAAGLTCVSPAASAARAICP